jgi:cytochrome b
MRHVLVYDLPTRLFHWLFAGFFITAFAIANLVDDESWSFPLHMLAGLSMVFVVALRIGWSLVGTRHARLGDLNLNPAHLLSYLRGMFRGGSARRLGHNPASSWAAVIMIGLALGLGTTGWLMAAGSAKGTVKELHELMANGFLAVVLLHVLGVVAHVLRHRDALHATMITGTKPAIGDDAPVPAARLAGAVFVVLTALFVGYLAQHYDGRTHTLDMFGVALQLGERDHD